MQRARVSEQPSPTQSEGSSGPSSPRAPRFGWRRVTRTLLVLGVAGACVLALYVFAQRLPAFASIAKSGMSLVGVIALLFVARTWLPRHGQRRHGERRHTEDRRT